MREGMRYHIARFAAKKSIDPTNSKNEFYAAYCFALKGPSTAGQRRRKKRKKKFPVDSKEREKQEIAKQSRSQKGLPSGANCPNRK